MMLFISVSSLLVAQDSSTDEEEKKFWWGPKFGLDLSSSTNNIEGITEQLKGNYQAGIFFQMGKKLYLQPEIYYASYMTDATSLSSINFIKVPLMLGVRLLDIGLVSVHVMGGPTYIKQLADYETTGKYKWELGAGANILGFITTDLRYTFKNQIDPTEIQDLIANGGMVNLTVGLRL